MSVLQLSARRLSAHASERLWRIIGWLQHSAIENLRYSRDNMAAIGAVGTLGLPAYYLIWRLVFPQDYENLPLRLLGGAICLPLMLVRYCPERWERWLPYYFWFAISYALPFFLQYMLLQNVEYSHKTEDTSTVWQMTNVIAVFLLVILMNDGFLIGLTFLLGTGAAWALFLFTTDTIHFEAIRDGYLAPMVVYLFILVSGSIFNHRRDMVQKEMLRAVSSVGSNIAHELRTPLLGIKSDANGVDRYLPHLIEGYEQATAAGLEVRRIRSSHLATLKRSLKRIDSETEYAHTIINMLLVNSGETRVPASQFERLSALECIRGAIDRYPFNSPQDRALVYIIEAGDFHFEGSSILFVHVMFNLLKNALYHIARAGKGEIFIWLEADATDRKHRLYFMDTGTGIPAHLQSRIFERFFTSGGPEHGSGIGLSFCRMVMETFGGSIDCESVQGEFTRFILTFPGADA